MTSPTATATASLARVEDGESWIVYQAADSIRLGRPDGSDAHPLVPSAETGPQVHPDWSRDGRRIAFAADAPDGTRDLWIADADGGGLIVLYDCAAPCAWADDPAWAPDDRTIAFQQGVGTGEAGLGIGSVATIELATGTVTPRLEGAATEYFFTPRWAPDGQSIVTEVDRFDSARLDASSVVAATIAVIDLAADPVTVRTLLPWESGAATPDWHPMNDTIAFTQRADAPQPELWTILADGTSAQRVTDLAASGGRALQPTWTPDGAQILFVAEATVGSPRAALVAPDGTGFALIGTASDGWTHPRLRPLP